MLQFHNFPRQFVKRKLTIRERKYLKWSTSYRDKSWVFFTRIEDDFRLLNKPYSLILN